MELSKLLSRLPIKGTTKVGNSSTYADFLPILGANGKLDASFIPASVVTVSGLIATDITFTPTGVIAATNVQLALAELASEAVIKENNLSDVVALTGFNNLKHAATESYAGVVELASDAEVESGTDTATDTPINGTTTKLVVRPSSAANVFVKKSGSTMTGMLVLPSTTPTLANHATRKQYVDDQITNLSNTVFLTPTEKIIWVSKGSIATDTRTAGDTYRIDKPFATLGAAKTAATLGDTIFVLPGTWNEKNLLKTGVNWYFVQGAKVIYSGSGNGAIFDDSATGANAAVTSTIMGYGIFTNNGSGSTNSVFYVTQSSTNLTIEGESAENNSGNTVTIAMSNGTTVMRFIKNIKNNSATGDAAISATGGTHRITCNDVNGLQLGVEVTGDATLDLVCRDIIGEEGAISLDGALGSIKARDIKTDTAGGFITVTALGGSTDFEITARKITAASSNCVYAAGALDLKINDAKLKCTFANSAGYAIFFGDNLPAIVLNNCDLEVDAAANYSMKNNSGTATVTLHGYSRSNKTVSGVSFSKGVFEV